MSTPYRITVHNGLVDKTAYWKDENTKEPAGVWWLDGGGLSRPATDVEKELWKRILELELSLNDNGSKKSF